MKKDQIEFRDLVGVEIKEGDCVAYMFHNMLQLGIVDRFTPRMVRVKRIISNGFRRASRLVKPNECLVVASPEITLYILKHMNATGEQE